MMKMRGLAPNQHWPTDFFPSSKKIIFVTTYKCKVWKAEAYKKAKASIWLVRHHLRSLNTVNEEHYMKNMSIERIT
jgi:hypothetical protein